jgi:molecular chaperone GrpE
MQEENRSAVEDNAADVAPAETPEVVDAAEITPAESAPKDAPREWAAEKAELEDLLRRRQAEFENFRRRIERERMDFAEYASMESVRALLPTVDDFERALKAARTTGEAESELVKGIELIYKRLVETLTKQGLEPIETEGRTFDPHLHNAVQRVEQEDAEDGTILEEYQRGYNFKGKLLRPSMVKVAVRS